ncbi:hypothetical protein C3B51_22740 [Pseudoalteromonas rubra]|uniref:Uncharacterized protein n=1 Tax=Pseudoalteromonas rubra TaxID=43658 RepID=A0A4Q7DZ36_9GAMM|nr:hypothetical protein C3B51_22740 [Pseudoalteromonas rubra]
MNQAGESIREIYAAFEVGTNPVSAEADGYDVVMEYGDGSKVVRSGGSRAWRNNNPGNLRNTRFSINRGSIGEAGGFAVFPTDEAGRAALVDLLNTRTYQRLTINEAINRYAPSIENNTRNYQTLIQRFTGLSGQTQMSTLSSTQINGVANAIGRVEGWTVGNVSDRSF